MVFFYLRVYVAGFRFSTPYLSLILINSDISNYIVRFIREMSSELEGADIRIFNALCSINGSRNGFTPYMYEQMRKIVCDKILLKSCTTETYGPSVCRYVYNDEYLGVISKVLSETLPFLLYNLFGPAYLNLKRDDPFQPVWADLIMIYLEIWISENHTRVVGLLKGWADHQISLDE